MIKPTFFFKGSNVSLIWGSQFQRVRAMSVRDGKQSPGNEGSGRDGRDEVGLSPKDLSGKSRIMLQGEMSLTGSCA